MKITIPIKYKYDLELVDLLLYIKLRLLYSDSSSYLPIHQLSFSNNTVWDILYCLEELRKIPNIGSSFELMGCRAGGEFGCELIDEPEQIRNMANCLYQNPEQIDADELHLDVCTKERSNLERVIKDEIDNFRMNVLDRGECSKKFYSFAKQEEIVSKIFLDEYNNLKISKFPLLISEFKDSKVDLLRILLAMTADEKIRLHKIWNKRKSWLDSSMQETSSQHEAKDEIWVEVEVLEKLYSQAQTISVESNEKKHIKSNIKRLVDFAAGGDLLFQESIVVSVKPKTIDFYFLGVLSESFNEAIDYDHLTEKCQSQYIEANKIQNYKNNSSPQEFCHQRKTRIKDKIMSEENKKLFDRMIQDTATTNGTPGYKMTNPQT